MVYLIAFFAALGVIFLLWSLIGLLVLPVFGPGMVTICPSDGDAVRLERQVRAYGWLRDGKRQGGTFVILDCGLTAHGMEKAARLEQLYDWVTIAPVPSQEGVM